MRELDALYDSGYQLAFEAPLAGLYRFTAIGAGNPVFISPGNIIVDLNNSTGFRAFMILMGQGDELSHNSDACQLYGAREPDEVPPEE